MYYGILSDKASAELHDHLNDAEQKATEIIAYDLCGKRVSTPACDSVKLDNNGPYFIDKIHSFELNSEDSDYIYAVIFNNDRSWSKTVRIISD